MLSGRPSSAPAHGADRDVRALCTTRIVTAADAPLVPPGALAASAALQDAAAARLRPLIEPVPLFALNSPSHRQRVQAQIADSAREANNSGAPARAAELFERAHSVLPTNALLISALNMRLKSGDPALALAGYGCALRMSLSTSQRDHRHRNHRD